MANLPETPTYDAGVYQLETTDPVQGGASGVSNSPLKNLSNRTAYLKQRVDNIESGSTDLPGYAKLSSPALTGSPTAPTAPLGDNSTKIANTAFVQGTIGGRLVKSVAGGVNVTLTAVEAGNAILELTGALTGNIAVIVPTSPTRSWIVKNATSGSFTLTIKTAAGTGVIVTQGTNAVVWTDGTNVYDALTDFDSPALTGTPTAPTASAATNSTQIATTAYSTYATDGRAAVNVAGNSNVTLTANQYGAAIVDLSGVITGNFNLVFPNVSGCWIVANNTTGSFTITAKTAAGTGVSLPIATAVVLYGDGTNIYFAGSASKVSFTPQEYSPTAGTTSLLVTGGYTPGNVMVEKNGSLLEPSSYTATSGTSVVLDMASVAGDTFTVYAFKSFEVADALTQASGDIRYVQKIDLHQIQTVSASVASNAMTVGLSPTSLDFRSSTLNSGAVNNRVVASPLSLTIPSGSTLGTINGIASRILILAIDNAGTVELAVYNAAGSANLDETGVISTTAIGAASNSLTVYSQIARANVPYRVIGYVDSAQATAGIWSSAPTTVQGHGGQAIAALSSFGFGQSPQNVTASRSVGTTYYNTTGKLIWVHVDGTNASNGNPQIVTGGVTFIGSPSSAATSSCFVCAPVAPGASYVITQTLGTFVKNVWIEFR